MERKINSFLDSWIGKTHQINDAFVRDHTRILSSDTIEVFLTAPFEYSKNIQYIPFIDGGQGYVEKNESGNLVLTSFGFIVSKRTLRAMTEKAYFYLSNKEKIIDFYDHYHEELSELSSMYDLISERYHQAVGWRDHAILLKQKRRLEERIQSLLRQKYYETFEKGCPLITESQVEEFKRLLSEQESSQTNNT